jgi:hypothetical protein
MVFDAMRADQFYIYSHPKALGASWRTGAKPYCAALPSRAS